MFVFNRQQELNFFPIIVFIMEQTIFNSNAKRTFLPCMFLHSIPNLPLKAIA